MADAKIKLTAEDKTQAAFASAKQGLAQVGALASAAGISLAALGGAATLGGLALMVKNIAQGIDAMNDLKDATGASIENISALESIARRTGGNFDLVSTSLIKFNMALGQTVKPGSDAEKVFKAIGLNAKELRDMDPAEAFRLTAVAMSRFADDGKKGIASNELFGKSLKEIAPLLKDVAEAGELVATISTKDAEEAEKFNKELYKMQASLTDIARDMSGPVITGFNGLIDKFREGQKEGDGFFATLWKQTELYREWKNLFGSAGPTPPPAALNRQTLGGGGYQAPSIAVTTDDPEAKKKAAAAAAALKKELEEQAKVLAELNGVSADFGERWDRLNVMFKAGKINLEQLGKAQAELWAKQAAGKKQLDDIADTEKAAIKAAQERQKLRQAESDQIDQYMRDESARLQTTARAAEEVLQTARDELAQRGLLKSQIAELTLVRLRDQLVAHTAGSEAYESIMRQIQAQEQLIGVLRDGELLDANEKAAKEAATAWAQVGDAFVDNLMAGGKSVAQYLKDLFRTLVLRPILQPVGQAMGGFIGGLPSAAMGGQAGSAGSGMLGTLGNAMGLAGTMGTFGAGLSAGFGGLTGSIGSMFGMAGTGATLGGALSAGTTALAAGNIAGGLGTLAGALGPIAMGIFAIASLVGKRGETRSGGQYSGTSFVAGPSGGEIGGDAVRGAIGGTMASINDTLRALGSSATLQGFVSGLEQSTKGKGFAFAGGRLSTGAAFGQGTDGLGYQNRRGSMTSEQASAAFAEELKQATLQALQAANVPGLLGDYLRQLGDIDALSGGALDAALERINTALTQKQQLEAQLLTATSTDLQNLIHAREAERDAIDESQRGLYDQVRIATDKRTLEERLFDLTATDLEKLTRARELERAALDASLHPMLDLIYAAEDLKTAAAGAAEAVAETSERYLELRNERALIEYREAQTMAKRQGADRLDRLASERAREKAEAEAFAQRVADFEKGAEAFTALNDSLLRAGDAAGLLAAVTQRAYTNPNAKGLPQWGEGTTAAQFNYDYAGMQARLGQQITNEMSANALRVQNVGAAIGGGGGSEALVRGAYIGMRDAIVQAAGDAGYAVRDAVDSAALVAAQMQVRSQYAARGPGLASVGAARDDLSSVSRQGVAGRYGFVYGEDVAAYGQALSGLEGALKQGKISAEQFDNAVAALDETLPGMADLLHDTAAQLGRIESAAYELGRVGLDSIQYYFGSLSDLAGELAAAAEAAAEPLALVTGAIGRMNSFATAFGQSAGAARYLSDQDLAGALPTIQKAEMVSLAASIASSVITTADAAAAAEKLAESAAFAGADAQGLRGAALLIDGIRQYDSASFEKAFIRASNAYGQGQINSDQFTELFSLAVSTYQGVDEETKKLTASMESLRTAMSDFYDRLLVDQGRTTLTGPQTMAELQRQYDVALSTAMTGDRDSINKFERLATSMLDKDLYASQADYNTAFGSVLRDAKYLETVAINTITSASSSADVVAELRAMNVSLSGEVKSLREDLTLALAQIAGNTSKTASGIDQMNTVGLPT